MLRRNENREEIRPISELLVDLHVYIVSPDQWREHLQNAVNQIINDAVSAGFIRVHPEGTLGSLREEIENQLGPDAVPQEYIFLRSVGRCLTKVRAKQEYDLKVKHFLPPQGYSEIYVIDASAVQQTPLPTSDSQSRRPANGYHSSDSSWSDASLRKQQQPLPPIKKESRDEMNEQDQQQDQGDYVIPLSATPSHSPDYTARALEEEKRRKLLEEIERKKEQERLEELKRREEEEKRRLEELRKREEKRKREEEERRRREEEERRKQEEEERRRLEEKRKQEDEERRRREDEDRRRREEEARRKRLEEEERQRRDEEERRRRDEERRRLDEEERKRKEDDKRRQEEEERNRLEREAEERKRREEERKKFEEREMKRKQQEQMTNAQKLSNEERKALVEQLMRLKEERRQLEGKREDLARNARQMQTKAQSKRSQARDVWKRRYFDEKKKTPALEDEAERLHEELEMLHKKILSQLETAKEEKTKSKSSDQSGLRFKAMRMQHEIDNLERLVENVKMKLTTEMKLRNQAQMELRALRAELAEKKIGLIQSESQHQNIQGLIQHEDYNSLYVPRI